MGRQKLYKSKRDFPDKKICGDCGKEKTIKEFYVNTRKQKLKSGKIIKYIIPYTYCRICHNTQNRKVAKKYRYSEKYKSYQKKYHKKWYKKNKEYRKKYLLKYKIKNTK